MHPYNVELMKHTIFVFRFFCEVYNISIVQWAPQQSFFSARAFNKLSGSALNVFVPFFQWIQLNVLHDGFFLSFMSVSLIKCVQRDSVCVCVCVYKKFLHQLHSNCLWTLIKKKQNLIHQTYYLAVQFETENRRR